MRTLPGCCWGPDPCENGGIKRACFTEKRIIGVLRENKVGAKACEVVRKHDISKETLLHCETEFSGMGVSAAQQLRVLKDEQGRIKPLLADSMLQQDFASITRDDR